MSSAANEIRRRRTPIKQKAKNLSGLYCFSDGTIPYQFYILDICWSYLRRILVVSMTIENDQSPTKLRTGYGLNPYSCASLTILCIIVL